MTSSLALPLLDKIAGRKVDRANAGSVIAGLEAFPAGIDQPHRLAQYLAQLFHESGAFRYDREIASGAAYEGRLDLGNTEPGDGVRFKGRTAGMLTGRGNYLRFTAWCAARGLDPPDFTRAPELVNTDPWEGLGPIWYWDEGSPTGQSLNHYADQGDVEMISVRINGGRNGLADRFSWYTRNGLVMLGYGRDDVGRFQAATAGLKVDGDPGPRTRAALHAALKALPAATSAPGDQMAALRAAVEALAARVGALEAAA